MRTVDAILKGEILHSSQNSAIEATELGVTYPAQDKSGEKNVVFNDLSLAVGQGEFVSLIGPSGCGKSTLLHCLGSLMQPTTGSIAVNGERVTSPDPRKAAFVFQDYSLLPWKSVEDNVALGLKFARVQKDERLEVAREKLELMGLAEFSDHLPSQLSGGMQQRVAVARALAMDAKTLLLDEPFGALDEQTRRRLGDEISAILTEQKKTVVLVTHSLDEALYWGDRVLVMGERPAGIIEEIRVDGDRPRELSFMAGDDFASMRARLLQLIDSVEISE